MNIRIVKTLYELKLLAKEILQKYTAHPIFVLYGPIGIGKTAFVKKALQILEVEEEANSPSFSIVNEYFSAKYGSIFHFDLYRINHASEIYDLGYEEYLYSGNLCFIEWPELMEPLLPEKYVSLVFSLLQDGNRKITIDVKY